VPKVCSGGTKERWIRGDDLVLALFSSKWKRVAGAQTCAKCVRVRVGMFVQESQNFQVRESV